MRRRTRTATALRVLPVAGALALAAVAVSGTRTAFAALVNDNFASATTITSLPFSDSGDLNGDTNEPGEPQVCTGMPQTVWYTLSSPPISAEVVTVGLAGSDYGVNANVWQSSGGGIGSLNFMTCVASFQSPATIQLNPGSTYYIQAGSSTIGPAHLQLSVQAVPPPVNDGFASATAVAPLPFSDTVDTTGATLEPGEPSTPNGTQIAGSVWYSVVPATAASVTATASTCCTSATLAVYTGSSVSSLTQVAPAFTGYQTQTFSLAAGTAYAIQVGRGSLPGFSVSTTFTIQVTPPPTVGFSYYPQTPSIFDTIQWYDNSYDPAGVGIASEAWSLGDGGTATGCCPSHRYAADGDYTVKLTVTTADGRTGTASQVVSVRTHDVAITKFMVPTTAGVNQTKTISVGISDTRYPDTVQVQLLKSVPGTFTGFQLVGTLTQSVIVQSTKRTTPFTFNYTFTPQDGVAGKVTFEAVATIIGWTDAQPGDNTVIALPTLVK